MLENIDVVSGLRTAAASFRPQSVAVKHIFCSGGERKAMLEKLLLAIMITFCLNLSLGYGLPSTTKTASSFHLLETQSRLVRLLVKIDKKLSKVKSI